MKMIRDFAGYIWRLVWNAIVIGAGITDGVGLLVKALVPPTRRPPILDASWVYLVVLAFAFAISAYGLDRDLRAKLSTERRVLVRELRERLIRLKTAIESRSPERIPIDQFLVIEGLAKDLGDRQAILKCGEMKSVLQRHYDGGSRIADFQDATRDYDSVRTRIDFVRNRLEGVS